MDELIELERAGWTSLCDGTGDACSGTTMIDDGVMVRADGSVMTRTDVVAALGHAPAWASFDMQDVRVVPIGDDSTALVYVGTGHRDGDAPAFVGPMTSVDVRRDGRWRLAIYQQTPTRTSPAQASRTSPASAVAPHTPTPSRTTPSSTASSSTS